MLPWVVFIVGIPSRGVCGLRLARKHDRYRRCAVTPTSRCCGWGADGHGLLVRGECDGRSCRIHGRADPECVYQHAAQRGWSSVCVYQRGVATRRVVGVRLPTSGARLPTRGARLPTRGSNEDGRRYASTNERCASTNERCAPTNEGCAPTNEG